MAQTDKRRARKAPIRASARRPRTLQQAEQRPTRTSAWRAGGGECLPPWSLSDECPTVPMPEVPRTNPELAPEAAHSRFGIPDYDMRCCSRSEASSQGGVQEQPRPPRQLARPAHASRARSRPGGATAAVPHSRAVRLAAGGGGRAAETSTSALTPALRMPLSAGEAAARCHRSTPPRRMSPATTSAWSAPLSAQEVAPVSSAARASASRAGGTTPSNHRPAPHARTMLRPRRTPTLLACAPERRNGSAVVHKTAASTKAQ